MSVLTAWSPSAAPATRWTPRSSPPGWRRPAGGWPTATRPAWCWSTRAGSSRRPSRSRSANCSTRPTAARRWSRPAAWPSGTATRWPPNCPRPRCSASTTTATSGPGWMRCWPVSGGPRTSRGTGAACCRSPRPAGRVARRPARRDTATAPAPQRSSLVGGSRTCRRGPRPHPGRGRCGVGWPPGRSPRSRSLPAVTGGAASVPSPRSVVRSCPARRRTWWPRRTGWPARASVNSSWSARTPPRTARTWAIPGCWTSCCPRWPRDGISRVRVSYLQPAEMRPALIEVMTSTPGVAPYFDLSFQHASGRVLRAMRRFGDRERFGALLDQVRQDCPDVGVRSNFIVGFPGETDADVAELQRFLSEARLDAIGVFGYSDEDGTEAARLEGQLDPAEIARRVDDLAGLADELMAQRAADRVGEVAEVLLEEDLGDGTYLGRAAHQAPEVDGTTTVRGVTGAAVGDMVPARVAEGEGVDLVADWLAVPAAAAGRG